jgi:hypothetical protein
VKFILAYLALVALSLLLGLYAARQQDRKKPGW